MWTVKSKVSVSQLWLALLGTPYSACVCTILKSSRYKAKLTCYVLFTMTVPIEHVHVYVRLCNFSSRYNVPWLAVVVIQSLPGITSAC